VGSRRRQGARNRACTARAWSCRCGGSRVGAPRGGKRGELAGRSATNSCVFLKRVDWSTREGRKEHCGPLVDALLASPDTGRAGATGGARRPNAPRLQHGGLPRPDERARRGAVPGAPLSLLPSRCPARAVSRARRRARPPLTRSRRSSSGSSSGRASLHARAHRARARGEKREMVAVAFASLLLSHQGGGVWCALSARVRGSPPSLSLSLAQVVGCVLRSSSVVSICVGEGTKRLGGAQKTATAQLWFLPPPLPSHLLS
jgi:hypothetical protein